MRLYTRLAALILVVVAAAPLRAQVPQLFGAGVADSTSLHPDTVSVMNVVDDHAVVATSGASLTGLRSGVHSRESARALQPNAAATRANLGQARALMVVGAAALITGAIIGGEPGTIIMVGGAVVGLYGLYQYLQ